MSPQTCPVQPRTRAMALSIHDCTASAWAIDIIYKLT